MITKWSIENFKSFQNKTEIALAPVTVLAGANSSGKSTIVQSILLLKQTVQYGPTSRAMALNGPMLKLGKFNDVKNVQSQKPFIGIGWEIEIENADRVMLRSSTTSAFSAPRIFGRSAVKTVSGEFTWEVPPDVAAGPGAATGSEALIQLQPKLKSARVEVSLANAANEKREITIDRKQDEDEADFSYDVEKIDAHSQRELLSSKPESTIIGATLRHFFPGQIAVRYDAAKERAFRISNAICSEDYYRHRTPQIDGFPIRYEIIRLLQEKFVDAPGSRSAYPLLRYTEDTPATLADVSDAAGQSMALLNALNARLGKGKPTLSFLDLRPQIDKLLFDEFVNNADLEREAIEATFSRPIYDASDQASAYFIAAVRYLGPLRDEPKPIYPLEALINPTEVGYRGEHTAAVLDLHKDRRIRYLPSNFDPAAPRMKSATLHDAVVDWLNYVGVASEVKTSDSGKFGHEIQVRTEGVEQYHDLTNVGVGVSQVLPIIVMALLAEAPSMLIFEQPELHLHPKVQARLADFFLSVALMGKQCLLETHSEYLVERFRLRIAEAEGEALSNVIQIYFTERGEGGTTCRTVPVSKYGAILDWPKDFFDQGQQEAEKILEAARKKRKAEREELPK